MYLFIAEVVDDAQQICSLINYVGFLGNDVTAKFVINKLRWICVCSGV